MFINGVKVEASDLETLINGSTLNGSVKEQLLELFCSEDGRDMYANQNLVVSNLSLGRIIDEGSFANKYFNNYAQATNSLVIVINPDNYEFADDFGTIVDNKETQEMTLRYNNGSFYNGATLTTVAKGETVEVYRNNKLYQTVRYGVDDFSFVNGDIILVSVVSHKYEVAVDGHYTVKDDVEGVLEYVATNNFADSMFLLNNLSEDAFAPNASVSDVLSNDNAEQYCPDLGYANIDNLTPYEDSDVGDTRYHRVIDNLVITGDVGSNGAYISDWFRFQLISDSTNPKSRNYDDAFVEIDLDDTYDGLSDADNLGDLAIPNASISPRSKISKTETTSFASPDSTVPRIVTP